MDEDFLLIRKMKSGDEEALESFVRKYYPVILRYCGYHVSDSEYAEDITQETFERFFRNLPDYRHCGKMKNYLYIIAGNLCKNVYRKNAEIILPQLPEAEDNPMESVSDRLDLESAVNSLPPELREVIILFYFQELKLREIAGILDIGLPLVKYRLKKSREQLGRLLGKEAES